MVFTKGHFHFHQHDRPPRPREEGRHCVSERLWHWAPVPAASQAACTTMVRAPQPARTHQPWFPWARLLSPVWLNIFTNDSDDKLRSRFIQFSNSRKLGRVVSVLGDGWDLRMVPTEQITVPNWDAFYVMPYSRLGWPCSAKSPSTELVLKARTLLGPAKLLVASAHCPWTRQAQNLASPTPAWGYLHCQPGWLLVYTGTSALWSAIQHTCHFAT